MFVILTVVNKLIIAHTVVVGVAVNRTFELDYTTANGIMLPQLNCDKL